MYPTKKKSSVKRVLIILLLSSLVVLFGASWWGYSQFKKYMQPLPGHLNFDGKLMPISIQINDQGVPTIMSVQNSNTLDVYHGQGFVHAQDRLWQMELQKRLVQGRLSELFGERALDKDKFHRILDIYGAARKTWAALSPQAKKILTSYTNGVNQFIQLNRYPPHFYLLGIKPEPWTEIDSIAWQKYMAWTLNLMWIEKLKAQEIVQDYGAEAIDLFRPLDDSSTTILSEQELIETGLPIVDIPNKSLRHTIERDFDLRLNSNDLLLADPPGKGSNNWVMDGSRTQSGKPILANDPHLDLRSPNVWYLIRLQTRENQVVGGSIPGIPGIIIGFNNNIAWGMTNVNPNVQDLYIETDESAIEEISETIKVKNKPDVNLVRRRSPRGPIISDALQGKTSAPLSLAWVGFDAQDETITGIAKVNFARDWYEFIEGLNDFVAPAQNFIYADTNNNIGYYLAGRIPLRVNNDNPVPVYYNDETQWQEMIPFAELPHVYNPSKGYIVTANNQVATNKYKHRINYIWQVPDYRTNRINELILNKNKHDIQSNKTIQLDVHSGLWHDLKPYLCKHKPTKFADKHRQICDWDGQMAIDRAEPALFALWYRKLNQMIPLFHKMRVMTDLSHPEFIIRQLETDGEFCKINDHMSCQSLIDTSFREAVEELSARKWPTWGQLHQMHIVDPVLETIPLLKRWTNQLIATPGGLHTINVGKYDQNLKHIYGAGYRHIADLADISNSVLIQSVGQSELFLSKNYNDLASIWAQGKYLQVKDLDAMQRLLLSGQRK